MEERRGERRRKRRKGKAEGDGPSAVTQVYIW
jgi:hypothetical protein